ncbi:MAG: LysM peptidoglycan-binding domain-containing protein [Gammaproteobacteria bacterium]
MKYLITLVCIIFHFKVLASDPFTNEIGLIKEQPVAEIIQEEEVVVEENTEAATDVAELLGDETTSEEVIQVAEAVEEEVVDSSEMTRILNIDPMIAHSLKDYTLKGTALSKESKPQFKRARIKKYDQSRIPTTHTIKEGETIEKIAFRYGFSLRELEIANAIYPGSRELVVGDKLVIPSRFHIVKESETFQSISEIYKIDPIQLASYNDNTDEDILLIGDKLFLPFFVHVTDANETISQIAEKYEREITELVEFNNLGEDAVILNENQLVRIPIYANHKVDYANLDKKSVNDFDIDRKNLAIVEINGGQYMVREGDRIGNKDGLIVSIESKRMIVLEDNLEFEFFINTPIVGQAIASLPEAATEIINPDGTVVDGGGTGDVNNAGGDQAQNTGGGTVTDVEDLFN